MSFAIWGLVVSGLGLFLIYGGYLLVLKLIVALRNMFWLKSDVAYWWEYSQADSQKMPNVTVYFSALNEESVVRERIANIMATDYPAEQLEIIVISDGSTDGTVHRVQELIAENPERNIQLVEFSENRGRAAGQNEVARIASADILVSTDADARFTPRTIGALVAPFQDPRVGVVGGVVLYETEGASDIGSGYAKYRGMERTLRSLETELGVLVKTDGPCLAYRKSVWEPIEAFEDVDQVIALLARKKGLRAVQADKAVCFDKANQTAKQEMRQRARMTRKALLSTFNRWHISDWLRQPCFTIALMVHKVLRFFSPVFTVVFVVSALLLMGGAKSLVVLLGLFVLLILPRLRKLLYAYLWAQVGFSLGIAGWLKGDRAGAYMPTKAVT